MLRLGFVLRPLVLRLGLVLGSLLLGFGFLQGLGLVQGLRVVQGQGRLRLSLVGVNARASDVGFC